MIIIADSNEQAMSPETISNLRTIFPNLSVSSLSCGDLNAILDDGSKLAIERKEIHDFLNSIGDGRVFSQVENMATGAKYYAIIIEGYIGFTSDDMVLVNGEETNWKGVSVRGALFSIQWSGCPVTFAPKGYYAFAVNEMINLVSKDDQHLQKIHRRIITFPPIDIEIDILTAFPDIGLKRAMALFDYIGGKTENPTLAEAICWGAAFPLIKGESRPTGWGNKIVDKFRKTLGLRENQYLEIKEENGED